MSLFKKNNHKLFVYLNGPHDSYKILCEIFDIGKIKKLNKINFLGPIGKLTGFFAQGFFFKGFEEYFFEGSAAAAIAPLVKTKNNKLIIKGNDNVPYWMESSKLWEFCFKKIINLNRYTDGLIAVSKMVQEDYLKFFKGMDIQLSEGFMLRNAKALFNLKRKPNDNFITISSNSFLKGLDHNLSFFLELKKQKMIPKESEYFIIGVKKYLFKNMKINEKEAYDNGIRFIAFTRKIEDYIENACFQLHLARYEPNAVSIMEGMSAGLIPIVSHKTGNKNFIKKIEPRLVINISKPDFTQSKINQISFLFEKKETKKLSQSFRSAEAFYNSKVGIIRWKKAYEYYFH